MGLLGDAFKYAWDNISGRQQNIDNQKYSYEMYKRQRDDNRHDALVAYERQQDLLQRQQNFELKTSDPAFQMSRMQSAGINPNLIAGQISPAVNTPSVPTAPQSSPATFNPQTMINPMDNLSTLIGIFSSGAQFFKTNRETKKLSFDIDKVKADLHLTDAQTEKVKAECNLLSDEFNNLRPRQQKKLDAETKDVLARVTKTLQDIEQSQQLFPDALLKLHYEVSNAAELLEQSKTNTRFLEKRFERFQKNFENILKVDDATLNAVANQAQSTNSAYEASSQFMRNIQDFIKNGINQPPEAWQKLANNAIAMILLYLQQSMMSHFSVPSAMQVPDK